MKAKNKHIVILTPGFPKNEADTTCIPALQIYVKALRDISRYDITVMALHYPKKNTTYHWNEIPVYAMGSASVFFKIQLWLKAYRTLKQIHKERPIDVIHSFWLGECAFIGHWFSKKNHVKHLTTLMGQDALKSNKYARILPIKKMPLITLSEFQQKVFGDNFNAITAIIPWGVNEEMFPHVTQKTIEIIGVGSLIPLKNYELFIDVIFKLNQRKAIKVVLVGDGVLKEKLENKIRLLQLENTITLKGELQYEETLQCISQSKILLHTSNYEGFGLVFAEALQNKTRIVSKKVGCAYSSPNWILCSNETEMITACENSLLHAFSEAGKNPYTIEKTTHKYLEIYDK